MQNEIAQRKRHSFALHGYLGVLLIVVFWYLNWTLSGPRTHWGFFPQWLGYCLVIDALVLRRKGTSLLTRNPWAYIGLFLISAPAWWLFELLNLRVGNWDYLGRNIFGRNEYPLFTSLSFSTVIPAVFGTAELVSTFAWFKRPKQWLVIPDSSRSALAFFIAGWSMLLLLLIFPMYFFPLLWISVFFIIEPLNVWLGNRTLAAYTAEGNWRPILTLWAGVLICGFFWEMWNYYSYPKWVYHVPFVGFAKIFEMPLLGYGGYLPFSMEVFSLYHLVLGLLGKKRWNYVEVES